MGIKGMPHITNCVWHSDVLRDDMTRHDAMRPDLAVVLIADRFIRDDNGRTFDLATAKPVRLVERATRHEATRRRWRARCEHIVDRWHSHRPSLLDFAEVGETQFVEAYERRDADWNSAAGPANASSATRADARSSSSHGRLPMVVVRLQPQRASAGACAVFDDEQPRELRRLYVRAPRGAGLTTWLASIAREARQRGFVPLSPFAVARWPEVALLVRGRSVVVLCDRTQDVRPSLTPTLVALARADARVAVVIMPLPEMSSVAALELPPMPVQTLVRAVVRAGAAEAAEAAHSLEALAHEAEGLPGRFMSLLLGATSTSHRTHQHEHQLEHEPQDEPQRYQHQRSTMLRAAEASTPYEGHPWTSVWLPEAPPATPAQRTMILADAWNLHAPQDSAIRAAEALIAHGRWASAIRTLRADIASHHRRHAARPAVVSALALARVHLMRCELAEADRWCHEAGELAATAEDEILAAEAMHWSGLIALDQADLERSERWLRMAMIAADQHGHRALQLQLELSLARCLFWQGRIGEMSVACDLALTKPGKPRDDVAADPRIRLQAYRLLARRHVARHELSEAGDALSAASALMDKLGASVDDTSREREHERAPASEHEDKDEDKDKDEDPTGARSRTTRSATRGRADASRKDAGELRTAVSSPPWQPRAFDDHERREWTAALHVDRARLQLAIGDRDGCNHHLGAALAARPSLARLGRLRLLQLEVLRFDRTEEARRRTERLGQLFLQRHTPRLLRLRARYLIESASSTRRTSELATFIDRYGETALAGRLPTSRPVAAHGNGVSGSGPQASASRGGGQAFESRQATHFRTLLQISHASGDERVVLTRICQFVREELGASFVAVYAVVTSVATDPPTGAGMRAGAGSGTGRRAGGAASCRAMLVSAGHSRLGTFASKCADRVLDTGLYISPVATPEAIEAGAPVRASGATIGAIICRWTIDAAIDRAVTSTLLPAAGEAAAPHVQAILDRAGFEDGFAVSGTAFAGGVGAGGQAGAGRPAAGSGVAAMLGVSPQMVSLRETIRRVADSQFPVVIVGESGSGKELVARALHQQSLRRLRRFCAVNCAALSDDLLEAELFGHARGAFTGALAERVGLFEEAHEGTLFLDEVGELSARAQAKLLRAIQEGEIRRIGENLPRRVQPRIVAATNRVLHKETSAGRFRDDLLYRLDVVRISVPPLRERLDDVPVLARAFWEQAVARSRSRATIDPETLAALARYDWPGNVRELQNVIARLAVQAPARGRLDPAALPLAIRTNTSTATSALATPKVVPLDHARRAFEEQFVRSALTRHVGDLKLAALDLGVTRQGLHKLLARLGIDSSPNPTAE